MTANVIDTATLDRVLSAISEEGFTLIGPTVRDQAIVYDRIGSTADLPMGITDEHEGGHYRIRPREDKALFGYNLGPISWKTYLYPSHTELFRARRSNGKLVFEASDHERPRYAFIGVRACELMAIEIQDKVFLGSGHVVDPTYASRREDLFIISVNCGQAASTCFCGSMGTGPGCDSGYDVVITEVPRTPSFDYVVESGSLRGEALLEKMGGRPATAEDLDRVESVVDNARERMGRTMAIDGIRDLLVDNPEHPRWDQVADRCLTCGNCTLACPTCFCSTTEDTVSFDGDAIRSRRWDSCFSLDFSGLHGHPVRGTPKARYRHWMTHKLATWYDQFHSSGCVGCGRCITWCPVGIDITEEVAAIRKEPV